MIQYNDDLVQFSGKVELHDVSLVQQPVDVDALIIETGQEIKRVRLGSMAFKDEADFLQEFNVAVPTSVFEVDNETVDGTTSEFTISFIYQLSRTFLAAPEGGGLPTFRKIAKDDLDDAEVMHTDHPANEITETRMQQWDAASGDKNVKIDFPNAANVWTHVHGWGKYPSVVCIDMDGRKINGAVSYANENEVSVSWNNARAGSMILN